MKRIQAKLKVLEPNHCLVIGMCLDSFPVPVRVCTIQSFSSLGHASFLPFTFAFFFLLGSILQSHCLNPQLPIYHSLTNSPSLSLLLHTAITPFHTFHCWPHFSHPWSPHDFSSCHVPVLPPLSLNESLRCYTWAVSQSHVCRVTHIICGHL